MFPPYLLPPEQSVLIPRSFYLVLLPGEAYLLFPNFFPPNVANLPWLSIQSFILTT
jgi:hypothetical protein